MSKMPVVFIGHGSPMNTLESNRYTDAWKAVGEELPKPRALLVISAHWYIGATAVTAMPSPRTIHDFYGFPPELNEFEYPAPGSPEVAREVVETVMPIWVGLDKDQWGLDHGTWSVLAHMYPEAGIPVLQLSINALKPLDYHLAVAERLVPLREAGVLILASGNVVHNLRKIDWQNVDGGFEWAERFDEAVVAQMESAPGEILSLMEHPDFDLAVPTPDHFIPLLYFAGAAGKDSVSPIIRGCSLGSVSMTSYIAGCDLDVAGKGAPAAVIPDDVPADNTNM